MFPTVLQTYTHDEISPLHSTHQPYPGVQRMLRSNREKWTLTLRPAVGT